MLAIQFIISPADRFSAILIHHDERTPQSGAGNFRSEIRRDDAYQAATNELLYNTLVRGWGDGSIRQPTAEEGPKRRELYPAIDDDEPGWDNIGISISEAGCVIPGKGEEQAIILLGQHLGELIEPDCRPSYELVKQFTIYRKGKRFIVEKEMYFLDWTDFSGEPLLETDRASVDEIISLSAAISKASTTPLDI